MRTGPAVAVVTLVLALGLAAGEAPPPEPVREPVTPAEESPESEVPAPEPERTYIWDTGTRWLEARQNDDGSWGRDGDFGLTGLVVLAYLSCGETHNAGASRDTVKAGLRHLIATQREDGSLADVDAPLGLSTHAVDTLALSEAYALTGSTFLRAPGQRAIDALLATRTKDGGWSGPAAIWGTLALKSAHLGGLDVPPSDLASAVSWLRSRIDVTTGRSRLHIEAPSAAAGWLYAEGRVAGAMLARICAGEDARESAELRTGALRLRDLELDAAVDPGDTYMITLALHTMPNDLWVPWVERLNELVPQDAPLPPADAGDEAIRDVALRVLTWRATQGYRRVFPDSRR